MEPINSPTEDENSKKAFLNRQKISKILIIFGVAVVLAVFTFLVSEKEKQNFSPPQYTAVYSLVPDTISRSAAIVVTLPKGVDEQTGKKQIKFTPELKGSWIDTPLPLSPKREERNDANVLVFKPAKALKVGMRYTVSLETVAGTIGKDFLAADDPFVAAIFPASDSEANEKSSITVVFNRPMVPLSTLDVMKDDQMPLTISPNTPGKYKWIGTRTVKFIPDERLVRSSHYIVSVASMTSTDGLAVSSASASFTTRPLRYEYITGSKDVLAYDQPITIHFNQPVDLSGTANEINVVNASSSRPIAVTVEYGTVQQYNETTNKFEKVEDQSTLLVYQKYDSHGRSKLWDFLGQYILTINKAYPTEGDIILDESRQVAFAVSDVVQDTSAVSERSNSVRPDFFDPQGKLELRFFEPISIKSSDIEAPGLQRVEYGEKCEEGTERWGDSECPKVPDRKTLLLKFDPNSLALGQKIAVNLINVVNDSNLKINFNPIPIPVTVVPKLEITKSFPQNGDNEAGVEGISLCSNSPLVAPDGKNVGSFLEVSPEYEFKKWGVSYLVTNKSRPCPEGQFETDIKYGLMPKTDYKLTLKLVDHFGSKLDKTVTFKTGDMPNAALNFYHLQKDYNVTSPANTVLTYAEENMEYVDVTLCRVAPEKMISILANRPSYTAPSGGIEGCSETVSRRITLPKRYWIKNYFTIDIKNYVSDPLGHFVLTFSNPGYRDTDKKQVFERTYLTVTRLSVVEKKIEVWDKSRAHDPADKLGDANRKQLQNLYWVADMTNLKPVEGAIVRLYTVDYKNSAATFSLAKAISTNQQGIATGEPINEQGALVVRAGNDSAIAYSESKLGYGGTAQSLSKYYVYTDRPIYRPGDGVGVKGIYRVGYDGKYDVAKEKPAKLKIYDSADKEIFSGDLVVNEYGTFNATTTLPVDAPLGSYRIDVDGRGYGYFDVQEYVPAAFKVAATADKDEYIAGDTLHLNVDANYYFGVPLEGGTVEYSIVSQNYYFDKYRGDDYFQFGRDWYSCYDNCYFGDKFITRGTGKLDQSGKITIDQKMDFEKWFKKDTEKGSKLITVYVTVKNPAGQAVSTGKTVVVHAGEYYLGLATASSFAGKGQKVTMKVKSVDTNGKEISASKINLTYNRVRWISNQRQGLDGGYYYSWERKLEPVRRVAISTDGQAPYHTVQGQGNAQDEFTPDKEGEYEVGVKGMDRRGNTIAASYELYIYGDQAVSDLQPSNDNSLDLVVKKTDVSAGENAEFIIKSPYDHAKALITIERGNIYRHEVVDVPAGFYMYKFPVTADYIPNVYASAVLLSDKPEVKFGEVMFNVNTTERDLKVSVRSDKQNYLPGEDVKLIFEAKDSKGNPVQTEFSAAVVDESVLALAGNPKKNPVKFFYDGLPLTVSTLSNVKNILYKVDLPVGTKGGGGGSPDLARQKRGDFRDTAYWNAVIQTDASGRAEVRFKLPDNLTTWQAEAVGITKDTLVGAGYGEFKSSKDIMVVQLKPRFILPGDQFSVGATVFNRTKSIQKLTVSFQSETLILTDRKNKINLTIPANSSVPVYFGVSAPSSVVDGNHKFTIAAKNASYEDAVEDTIPIDRNDSYETVATGGFSTAQNIRETLYIPSNIVADKGDVTIKSGASLAVFLSDALKSMLDFSYYSCEETGSKLKTIAILKRASQLKNMEAAFPIKEVTWRDQKYPVEKAVQIGLSELYQNQNADGGFTYYKAYGNPSSLYLSIHTAGVLSKVKEAGFKVDETKLRLLYQYLVSAEARGTGYGPWDDNTVVLIASALMDLKEYGTFSQSLINRIQKIAANNVFVNEKASNLVLSNLYLVLAQRDKFGTKPAAEVLKALSNRLQIDSRGTYLAVNQNLMWEYYETDLRNTAKYLQVLSKAGEKSVVVDRILRWIIAGRAKDGSWGSTPNTLSVVEAFTDYLMATRENESDFTLTTTLNSKNINVFSFATATVFTQNVFSLPLSGLPRDALLPLWMQKENHNKLTNTLYYDVAMKYYLPTASMPPRDEGFAITRSLFKQDDTDGKNPVTSGKVGEVLRVHDEIVVPRSRNFTALEDFIPAGAEIVNMSLATSDRSLGLDQNQNQDEEGFYDGPPEIMPLYPSVQESRDDRYYAAVEHLEPGTYSVDYYIRLLVPGTFQYRPAVVSENYFPENFGRTGGSVFTIYK